MIARCKQGFAKTCIFTIKYVFYWASFVFYLIFVGSRSVFLLGCLLGHRSRGLGHVGGLLRGACHRQAQEPPFTVLPCPGAARVLPRGQPGGGHVAPIVCCSIGWRFVGRTCAHRMLAPLLRSPFFSSLPADSEQLCPKLVCMPTRS